MENCSNCTTPRPDTFKTTEFLVFSTVMLVTAVAAIFFNILTAVVLSTRKEVFPPIRILLVNLLAGTTFAAVAVVMQSTDSIVLAADSNETTDKDVCRVYVFIFRSSAVARLCNLAAYSIAVMAVVITGKRCLKSVHTLLPIVITWLYALAISAYWLVPSASTYTYIGPSGVWCATNSSIENPGQSVPLAVWFVLGGIFPVTVCVIVIVSTWCYLRKHNLSEVTLFRKALVQLALFLFLANTFNLVNTTVPPILIQVVPNQNVVPYVVSTVVAILLWNTAIIIVIFIPPVRSKMVAILCYFCNKRQSSRCLGGNVQSSLPNESTKLLV